MYDGYMTFNKVNYQAAINDFHEARLKASLQEVLARLTGKSNELYSYDDVAEKLKLQARSDRGIHEIPIDAIVGSVGRYTDFTRTFLPRRTNDQERWARVKAIMLDPTGTGMDPIEVYKVGEVYFVLDGNHRVSIARQEGFKFIEAHIIEIKTEIPITPDLNPDDLIIKAEHVAFLRKTDIKNLYPDADFNVTIPGSFDKLRTHIDAHHYFLGLERKRDISYQEAVKSWYENVYTLFVEPIRERGIMRWFPDRTETDLYVWVLDHQETLKEELGWYISPEAVIVDLTNKCNPKSVQEEIETGHFRQTRLYDRYTEKLFREILVPIEGDENSFLALEQSILIAQKEQASLSGLHVLTPEEDVDSPETVKIHERFDQRCKQAGVKGNLASVQGKTSDLISSYSILTDLIVLSVTHPPGPGLSSLSSGIRSIIWRSARPILTVPDGISPLNNALLAFDGSVKSKEALFVASYLAELWKTKLTVMTLLDDNRKSNSVQDHARAYLEFHEVEADYILTEGSLDTFLDVSRDRDINLIIMGGYSGTALKEVVIGSLVNHLLRAFENPLLICR
jgi:nucleotide-binding universal stress UspA family protein